MNIRTLCALFASAMVTATATAQTVQTIQEFSVGAQPDAWKFSFQISRFLPSQPNERLVKVELDFNASTEYQGFSVTANKPDSEARWSVTETTSVKNLRFSPGDDFDEDEDNNAVKEVEVSSSFSGEISPPEGVQVTVPAETKQASVPTIVLTETEDLKRFMGETDSPKAINIKIFNK